MFILAILLLKLSPEIALDCVHMTHRVLAQLTHPPVGLLFVRVQALGRAQRRPQRVR